MKIKHLLIALGAASFYSVSSTADVKIANQSNIALAPFPNSNAMLEVESNSKGILLPRVALTSTTSPSPLSAHVAGMEVYNTTDNGTVYPCVYHNTGARWVSECDTEWYQSGGTDASTNNKSGDVYREGNLGVNEIGADNDFEVSEEFEIQSTNPTILLNDSNGLAYNTGLYMTDNYRAVFGISSDTGSSGNNLTFANYRPYGSPGAQGGFKWWSTKPEHTDWISLADNGSSDIITGAIDISRMETTMHLTAIGDLLIDGSLAQNSDERLKKNMQPIINAVADLNKIEPITYEWKVDTKNINGREIGFKAQNIETVFPELVSTEELTGIKSVAYANITPILVKAVQELSDELAAVKEENVNLKVELQNINQQLATDGLTKYEVTQIKNLLGNVRVAGD